MLEALISGERDPAVLADLAKGTLRSKIPELIEALTGRFKEPPRVHGPAAPGPDRCPHPASSTQLTARIEEAMEPFRAARELLATIPGVSPKSPT